MTMVMGRRAAACPRYAVGLDCVSQIVPVTEFVRRRPFLAIVALALLLGLAFQGSRGLWEPDEGRYTNVALQMLHSGDYVTLQRNDVALHFTKPPVTYWAIAASVHSLGRNEWAVRLPMALAYILSILLVYDLGRRFVPTRPWLPALVFATSPVVFLAANSVNTDTVLAATETLAMACYVRERFAGGRRLWLDAMWAGFGLAFLTKGPPALLPLLVVLAFEASGPDRWSRLRRVFGRPIGLLAFAIIGFTWFAMVIRLHPGLLDYFLGHEVYARIATAELRRFPQWYGPFVVYLPTLVLGTLPWLLLALPRLSERWRTDRVLQDPQLRFLWIWFALPLLVFCLARSRLPLYVLALFVPVSLLIARALSGLRFSRVGVVLVGMWIVLLLGVKLGAAMWVSDKDGRVFADKLRPMLPGKPDQILFVEDMTRNGLNLYFDSRIYRISFKHQPRMMSDSSYDETVAESLAMPGSHRVFIMKREVEGFFLDALRASGKQPVRLGEIDDARKRKLRDRVIYTVAGDFPETTTPRN
ncbi:hypothetical protein BH11PSE14_BH11PSE14_16970 [soil metagenome]